MEKHQKKLFWALVVSEASHIFCCVLPTVFSLLSLMAGVGMISVMPAGLDELHHILHEWEVPMIVASGLILGLGWWLYFYSRKIDCHDHGCRHEPCGPKKSRANVVLKIATFLFLINVSVYVVFHRHMGMLSPEASVVSETAAPHDHHHHH